MIDLQRKVHIRWMIRRDMPEVLEIEGESFEHPWTTADFTRHLQQRAGIGIVAEVGEKIVGYCCYELLPKRIRVVNFAVHPDWRRKSIVMEFLAKLHGKLDSRRRHTIVTEVRESNLVAQLFFRQAGFRVTHILKNYYLACTPGREGEAVRCDDDAYVFQYRLPQSESYGSRFGNLFPG